MTDTSVSVKSSEVTLGSDIGISSAILMKDVYLSLPEKQVSGEPSPLSQPAIQCEGGLSGPNAMVYITKITNRTPDEVIGHLLSKNPSLISSTGTLAFHSVILTMSMQMGDPSTTRFINGTIDIIFPPETTILDYSPKDKGTITAIIENGSNAIAISPVLVFLSSATQGSNTPLAPGEHRFGIPIGQGEQITGTFSKKTGYSFDVLAGVLLEYQGMPKNEHEMFWEIYPPMPPGDVEREGNEMLAVFSFIIQTPDQVPPGITVHIEGRVKGKLWGMISVKGSVVLQ
jgi:hypothetical protein